MKFKKLFFFSALSFLFLAGCSKTNIEKNLEISTLLSETITLETISATTISSTLTESSPPILTETFWTEEVIPSETCATTSIIETTASSLVETELVVSDQNITTTSPPLDEVFTTIFTTTEILESSTLECEHKNKRLANCMEEGFCCDCQTVLEPINPNEHGGFTSYHNAKPAACGKDGYTGDLKCDACNIVIELGKILPKTSEHYLGENSKATCSRLAKCENCGEFYGELNFFNHVNYELINQVNSTCLEDGYKEYLCNDCGLIYREIIPKACRKDIPSCLGWYCSICNNKVCDYDFFNSPLGVTKQHLHTITKEKIPEFPCQEGYSDEIWCLDCNKKIQNGIEIPAAQEHDWIILKEISTINYYYIEKECRICGNISKSEVSIQIH